MERRTRAKGRLAYDEYLNECTVYTQPQEQFDTNFYYGEYGKKGRN